MPHATPACIVAISGPGCFCKRSTTRGPLAEAARADRGILLDPMLHACGVATEHPDPAQIASARDGALKDEAAIGEEFLDILALRLEQPYDRWGQVRGVVRSPTQQDHAIGDR